MLIPIGFFGAGAAAGAYELIETITTANATTLSATFSSVPSTYKHLQLRIAAGHTSANRSVLMTLNSDTGANYARHVLSGNGSSVSSSAQTGQASIVLGVAPTTTSVAGGFIVDILDYASTSKNTTVRSLSGYYEAKEKEVMLRSGLWLNTAAVSTIKVEVQTSAFKQGSRFSLYGIKG